jgi:LPXTG-motif cell wall-anchored protein
LSALADATGGRVIPPTQTTPIAFDWPKKDLPLTPWLAAAGAAILAGAMLAWKRRQ